MANVTYKISGKHDSKGINDAKASLQSLGKMAETVNNVFKGFVAVKAIGAIKDLASGSLDAFNDAQVQSSRLFQSIQNNSKLSAGAFNRLSSAADNFQKTTIYDGDDLKKQEAFLSGMGLTEDQINQTMKAAIDMASSGVMPLDQAVESLGKTFTGTAGTLGKMNGKIKDMTKEQLKNGAAVAVMADKYKGMANTIANTPFGKTERLKVALGDIKETIGQIPAGLQQLAFDKLLSGATNLKDKLNEGINVLFIGLEHLPETGRIVFDAIGKMFAKVFSWDFIGQVLTVCCNQIGRMFVALFDGIKKGFTAIWETGKFNADLKKQLEKQQITVNLAYQTKTAKEKELEGKGIVNDYWKRNGADNPEYVKQMATVNANLEKERAELERLQAIDQKNYSAAIWQGISTSLKEAAKGTGESLGELGTILDKNFGEILKDIPEQIKKLSPNGQSTTLTEINAPNPTPTAPVDANAYVPGFFEKLFSNINPSEYFKNFIPSLKEKFDSLFDGNFFANLKDSFKKDFTNIFADGGLFSKIKTTFKNGFDSVMSGDFFKNFGKSLDGAVEKMGGLEGILGMFGQLGEVFKAIMSGNPIGLIIQAITAFMSMFTSIENVGKVLNLFGTIFERTGEIIEPIVNDMLAPLVDILEQIGEIIGTALAPVFQTLGMIIKPIAKIIFTILSVLTPFINIIAVFANLFIRLNPLFFLFEAGMSLIANTIAWFYNKLIVPIVNFVLTILVGVGNMVISIYNTIVNVLRSINIFGWKPFGGMSTVNKIDYDELKLSEIDLDNGSTNTSTSSASSSSASYTAAKDVTNNFYFSDNIYLRTEDELAVQLDRIMKNAHKKGYI